VTSTIASPILASADSAPYTRGVARRLIHLSIAVVAALSFAPGCGKTNGPGTEPPLLEAPESIEDLDDYSAARNAYALLDIDDPARAALRTKLRTYLIGYIDHALADEQMEPAVNALEQLAGLWLAHELRTLADDPELAAAAMRVYAAAAAPGRERPALLALGLAEAFGDTKIETDARANYRQLADWLLRTDDFATEPRVLVQIDRVLEDVTAHFPSPFLVDALADVYLERFRAAQQNPSLSGSGDPRIPYTGYLLARLYLRADDFDEAIAALDRIQGGEPTTELRSSIVAAKEAATDGRSPQAIDQLIFEFTPHPDDRLPEEIVVQSWGIVDNLARRCLARFPEHPPAELARGRVLRAQNTVDAAIVHYERSFVGKIRPTDREDLHRAWSELAELYQLALEAHLDAGESDAAAKEMLTRVEDFHERADEVWPQRPVDPSVQLAWMTVALAEFNAGRIAEAETLMSQTLVIEPHPAALSLLGTIAMRRGDYEDARTHYVRLGKLSDRYGDEIDRYDWQTNSKIGLAEVEMFAGNRDAGVTALRDALRQLNTLLSYPGLAAPLRAEFSLRRARVFFLLGEVGLGMQDAREAQRLAPERDDAISDPLMFTVVHGHLEEATQLLDIALDRDDIDELAIYYSLWVIDLAERLGSPTPPQARARLLEFAADKSMTAWQRKLASYGLGELSFDELAKLAQDPRERSEAYFYEALRAWRGGSHKTSLELMRKVVEQQMMGDFEYQMAQSYLRWNELPKTARAALEPPKTK
jgi:tetratricopeptide (TPR) repeat protein